MHEENNNKGDIWWKLDCGDMGVYDITDEQLNIIKNADRLGVRFVDIGEAFIQIAFIRGASRYYKRKLIEDPNKYKEVTPEEKEKNIERIKQLKENIFNR